MLTEFRLPALGADMESGTIVEWNVGPGDAVKRGQVVAVVETDKGAIDVEIFEDGILREIVVAPGTKVPVGTVIARVETGSAPASESKESAAPLAPQVESPQPAAGPALAPAPGAGAATAAGEGGGQAEPRVKITPAARARARELGVEVATLRGSGPGGVVTVEDVEKPGGMRAAIATAMSRSKHEIPHYYLSLEADVTPAAEWLAAHNAAVPVAERLLFAALLIRGVALACGDVDGFSGYYRDGRFEKSASVHVGVAVALRGGGLVAPAIQDTATKPLPVLMEEFRQLVMRARAGRLRASELAAPTIILTSLGESSVDAVFPIIQPPQVAIVGAGAVTARPWVVQGAVVPRQAITLSLGADHRVTDGRLGAQFLARISSYLADPAKF